METYERWNDALIEYFTYGAPVGSTIYLNIDDRALELIGTQLWGHAPPGGWSQDYLRAVRGVLVEGGCVFLDRVRGLNPRGRPRGVAFLGVLVLSISIVELPNESETGQVKRSGRCGVARGRAGGGVAREGEVAGEGGAAVAPGDVGQGDRGLHRATSEQRAAGL